MMRSVSFSPPFPSASSLLCLLQAMLLPKALRALIPVTARTGLILVALMSLVAGPWTQAADVESFAGLLRQNLPTDGVRAVAISDTAPDNLDVVTDTVAAIRDACPGVPVLVGGHLISSREIAEQVGADDWAPDAHGALELFQEILVR